MIRFENVHKYYGAVHAVRGLDITVRPGEFLVLIGPSGCGKTTALRILAGLDEPTSGSVSVDGQDLTQVPANKRDMGMVFQAYNLFPHMTVLRNLTLAPVKVHGVSMDEAVSRARLLLERVGLSGYEDSHPDRMSGGQQQRVALARAMAAQPALLLLDEVTSALDPELVGEMLGVLRDLADDGTTMILATHEMAFARDVATKVCFLDDGAILESGPPDQIFGNPSEERTRQFLRRVLN